VLVTGIGPVMVVVVNISSVMNYIAYASGIAVGAYVVVVVVKISAMVILVIRVTIIGPVMVVVVNMSSFIRTYIAYASGIAIAILVIRVTIVGTVQSSHGYAYGCQPIRMTLLSIQSMSLM
jgi:hypothetical protein